MWGANQMHSTLHWIHTLITRLLYNKYGHGINSIPGPTLASFTNLWRFFLVTRRRPELKHIELHQKYGSVIRIGPNVVSVSDPNAVKIIYAINAGFVKSDFYTVQKPIAKDGTPLEGLFSTTNEKYHAKLRRAISSAYSMSTLVQFEPLMDSTTAKFLEQLSERYADRHGADGVCDLGAWLQYYAFDVIGELTFSRRLGFVDQGADIDGIIRDLEKLLNYFASVGQMPMLHSYLLLNPLRIWLNRLGLFNLSSPVVAFARKCMADRLDQKARHLTMTEHNEQIGSQDFLSRFADAGRKDPGFMTRDRILTMTTTNMFAGSDTTAITLRAIFYYLLKNPECMQCLMEELGHEEQAGRFSSDDGLLLWNEVRDLPYLGAVIKEALRCHPPAGLALERVTPPGGVWINGYFLPGGTIVGCSPWTLHLNESIFGECPDLFKPERWLEASDARKVEMQNALFSFGAGSRTCIGKHISLLEMHKLVPAVLRRFEISFTNPEAPWRLHNAWFVKQTGFSVRLKTRKGMVA
ncbi:cytochrome P450 [Ilyonectria robusta]|uniref:cytochrome P450 n=1 Tax=Ilyonectria robusta TaxID=1079257 RepID=UPI001E8D0370|nr:cytochrome P450 [Ilyonectria robusta]KAH8645947.1 cytochrome P450 [Ilyonectria robusta]